MTASINSTSAVGLNTAETNVTWTVNSSGLSLNAGGYAGTNTAMTGGSVTLNTSGISINLPAYLTTADLSQNSSKYVQNWKLTGNTAGTTSSAQGTDLWLGGGNGVTISGSSNTLSFSVATNYQSQGAYLTTAMQSNAVTLSNILISAGASSADVSAITFSNANGVTFGYDKTNITASVAAQSNQTLSLAATSNTAGNTSGMSVDARSLTLAGYGAASVGYSTSAGGSTVLVSVPVQSAQTQSNIQAIYDGANSISTGTIRFTNANGVSFSVNGQTLSASVNTSYLGSNASTNYVQAAANFDGTNASGTIASGAISVSVAAQSNQTQSWAATSNTAGNVSHMTVDARSLTLAGYGAASVGFSTSAGGSTALVSVPVQSAQTQSNLQAIYDGANSISTGTVSLANANGVSFSINGQTLSASVAAQSVQTVGMYGLGNTTNNSSTTLDARSLSLAGYGIVTVGYSNGSIQISASATAAPSPVNFSAGATSGNLGSVVFSNSNNVSFGLSGSTITASAGAGATSAGWYATGNTKDNTSGSFALSSYLLSVNGALSAGYSNGSMEIYAPATSSLSATGFASISANGSTISIGATYTANVYAAGNTTGTSSGTCDPRSQTLSGGLGIQIAGSNGGWNIAESPLSAWEPFPIVTGTAYSSHAPASWWFNRMVLPAPLVVSNINVVKSFSLALGSATSVASSNSSKAAFAYTHGVTLFTRQNYGTGLTNLTSYATCSWGITFTLGYTSTSIVLGYSQVTDTTGGTTSYSTSSNATNLLSFFSGPKVVQIPFVNTLAPGEYFLCHAHSSTMTTSNSAFTLASVSNLHIAPQVVNSQPGVLGASGTLAYNNPWGIGAGVASALTTNNTMPGTVISGQTQNNWYLALSNA